MKASDLRVFDTGKTLRVDKKLHLLRTVEKKSSYVLLTVISGGTERTLTLANTHEIEVLP